MSLWVSRKTSELTWTTGSLDGTRPSATRGALVSPGNNTKGAYATVLPSAAMDHDAYGIQINLNTNFTGAAARNTIVDIGIDPAGGTSFTTLIPDLFASCASNFVPGEGINFYFPIAIPSGSTIGASASVNNATVGSLRCYVNVFGAPTDRSAVKVGGYATAFGVTAGSSSGTAVTAGTTAEGAWTLLASNIGRDYWWWQVGFGVNDTTMTNGNIYAVDLAYGDASNKHIILKDQLFTVVSANEALSYTGMTEGCTRYVPSGSNIYARVQCSGTADSNLSVIAYGVGG